MTRRIVTAVLGAMALAALVSCSSDDNPTGPTGDCEGLHLLAFARIDTLGDSNVYLYDLDQSGYRVLRNANSASMDRSPTITPEGRIVAFESARAGSYDIFMYDRCNEVLVDPPPGVNTTFAETEAAFSGDGNWLAFVRDTAGARRIRLVNGVSRLLDPLPGLAATSGSDWAPSVNQAATRIAFVSDRNGDADVLVWDRANAGILPLPELAVDGANDVEPSLSPDGRYLAFASDRVGTQAQGGYDIYLYDLVTGNYVPLPGLNSSANDNDPALSRPANYIVFVSARSGGQGQLDLWNYNRSTSALSQQAGQSTSRTEVQPALRWP